MVSCDANEWAGDTNWTLEPGEIVEDEVLVGKYFLAFLS